jgi:hypothetical protein
MNRSSLRRPDSCRGSVLLTALLISAILAISIGGFIALNTQSLKLATRSFYLAEGVNMAESGLEEAIWSFNQAQAGDASAWTGWDTSDGTTAKRTLTDFSLGANATGVVKIYIDRYNPPASYRPRVISEATVTLPGGGHTIKKMLEVRMKRRSYFAAGLVAKNGISFSGNNASVDSWISDPDNDDSTAAIPYSSGVRRDKGSVAASSITATVSVGNADIFGTVAVGSSSSAAISVGPTGKVGPFGTGNGVKDPASIATDFITNMENVTTPTGGTLLGSLGATIGTAGTTTAWQVSHIERGLTVYGDVTLFLTAGAGTQAINITGIETLTLAAGATLKIYTAGDIRIAGNGVLNNNDSPETLQIWGTSTSPAAQNIQIAGNGALKAVVYAPNGKVQINGDGDVMGAIVGKEIELTGNAAFHYDESLAAMGGDTPFRVYKWREILSPTERGNNAAHLAF